MHGTISIGTIGCSFSKYGEFLTDAYCLDQVIRDGAPVSIPSRDLTIGDVVQLNMGDIVPADLRMLHTECLKST